MRNGTEEESENRQGNIDSCNVKITGVFFFRILRKHVHGVVKAGLTICKTIF